MSSTWSWNGRSPPLNKRWVWLLLLLVTLFLLSLILKFPLYSSPSLRISSNQTYPSSSAITRFLSASEEARLRLLEKEKRNIGFRKVENIAPGKSFWDFFPPTSSCPFTTERIGHIGDGAKWICGFEYLVNWPKNSRPCLVYSFGVGGNALFESEVLDRTPCHVYGYDHTVSNMSVDYIAYPGRVFFSKVGLGVGTNSSESLRTLGELMEQNGHEWIDLLKMDIEGGEYDALDQIMNEFEELLPFGHLNVEVHIKNLRDGKKFKRYYDWWARLEEKGLRSYKLEVNYGAISNFGIFCVEYSFINIKPFFY